MKKTMQKNLEEVYFKIILWDRIATEKGIVLFKHEKFGETYYFIDLDAPLGDNQVAVITSKDLRTKEEYLKTQKIREKEKEYSDAENRLNKLREELNQINKGN